MSPKYFLFLYPWLIGISCGTIIRVAGWWALLIVPLFTYLMYLIWLIIYSGEVEG